MNSKVGKILSVMLLVMMCATVFAVAVPTNARAEDDTCEADEIEQPVETPQSDDWIIGEEGTFNVREGKAQ